jgi:N6-adenosine-specific RNA methylase IME4
MSLFSQEETQATNKKYNLIYADPPWTYNDKCSAGERGSCYKYNCMTLDEIYALRTFIDQIANDNCFLALWWVPVMPQEALNVVNAWGFRLINMKGFTWHKQTKYGKSHFGMGHWSRANTEDCLFAIRGKLKRKSGSVRQFVDAQIGRHSEKPNEIRKRLVQLLGDVPKIELFARIKTEGWDVWGDEV